MRAQGRFRKHATVPRSGSKTAAPPPPAQPPAFISFPTWINRDSGIFFSCFCRQAGRGAMSFCSHACWRGLFQAGCFFYNLPRAVPATTSRMLACARVVYPHIDVSCRPRAGRQFVTKTDMQAP
ncbi:hypothetical protein LZ31DRAFT_273966 [Colletotrichum somersetense]|nr:hypothetical protein LZ31DRAFT_273966 [Colletotrichum somersetense]